MHQHAEWDGVAAERLQLLITTTERSTNGLEREKRWQLLVNHPPTGLWGNALAGCMVTAHADVTAPAPVDKTGVHVRNQEEVIGKLRG